MRTGPNEGQDLLSLLLMAHIMYDCTCIHVYAHIPGYYYYYMYLGMSLRTDARE